MTQPRVFSAPGRVNLIGEHTDYNDGFVLPVAIDRGTRVSVRARRDRRVTAHSEQFPTGCEFDLDDLGATPRGDWGDYIRGTLFELRAVHRLAGADMTITSDLPVGAGLSSSAALEIGCGFALLTLFEGGADLLELAMAAQRGESKFVGTQCGMMDQLIACYGRAGHGVLIDCRSAAMWFAPMPPGVKLVIANTMVRHNLASSGYNRRREECEQGVRMLKGAGLDIGSLRDLTSIAMLVEYGSRLPDPVFRRCHHVMSENQRVLDAFEALKTGDLPRVGRLMAASHKSLSDDYDVSCRELDLMVDIASEARGMIGARMTGGGFGGCTINLVTNAYVDDFRAKLADAYERGTNIKPEIYVCEASDGVCEEL